MIVIVLLLFIISTQCVFATSLVLSDYPHSVGVDDEFTVTASFSGSKSSCGSKLYYLKGVLYADSGQLFGLTKALDGEWIDEGEEPYRYFSFTTSPDGTWSGQLSIKGNHADVGFGGITGEYTLRLDRFTQTGTSKAESSNTAIISLLYTPTPTPTSQPTPTPTPTPSPTPTPTPSPTIQATLKPTPYPSLSPQPTSVVASSSSIVMNHIAPASSPSGSTLGASTSSTRLIFTPLFIIGGSMVLLIGIIGMGVTSFKEE
jgi:hypothetical protein